MGKGFLLLLSLSCYIHHVADARSSSYAAQSVKARPTAGGNEINPQPFPPMDGNRNQSPASLGDGMGERSFRFIENKGQWNENVIYRADINSGTLFLEKNCFTYAFYDNSALARMHLGELLPESQWKISYHAFKVHFGEPLEAAVVSGSNPLAGYTNYFLGNDKSKWVSGAKAFGKINYENIYRNIDLTIYTSKERLKYDWIINPGGDAAQIKLIYEGAEKILIRENELIIKTSVNQVTEQRPFAYQWINGGQKEVKCTFKITQLSAGKVAVGYSLGAYNKSLPLIIDPTLIFASYSGSTADNFGMTATYDNDGNFYAGGTVFDNGYPITTGAYDVSFNNTTTGSTITDVVITKYNSSGSGLIYSTYLGGNGSETVHSLIVNSQDELFLYGVTSSTNFPNSSNAYDNSFNGGSAISFPQNGTGFNVGTDIYVSKFNAAGTSLLGSTYIGGSANDGVNYNNNTTLYDSLMYNYGDQFRGEIMVDNSGNCYVATSSKSPDFPIINGFQNTLNGDQDAVIFKFDPGLSTLLWSTFLGGAKKDAAYSVKVDSGYNVYVTGGTASPDFPATINALNATFLGGKADGFVAKISSNGSQLLSATFIGTSAYDQCYFAELDGDTNVYLVGQTLGSFSVSPGVYSNANSPQYIIKLNNTLDSVFYSTVFGNGTLSKVNISPAAFLVDDCQNVYVSGWGASILQSTPLSGMPVTSDALFPASPDGYDFYLFVLARNASALIYATYFGGSVSREHVDGGTSRFDKKGVVYQSVCAGCGSNSDFPTTPGAWSNTNNSFNCNNGTFKFDFQIVPVASLTTSTSDCDSCTGTASAFASGGISPYTFQWDASAGGGTSSSVSGLCAGTYSLTVTDSIGCPSYNSVDIIDNSSLSVSIISAINPSCADSCNGTITAAGSGGFSPYTYAWSNNSSSATNTGLCPGMYFLTITDVNNCMRFASATLQSPSPLLVTNSTVNDALCAGVCDGSASVSVSGGTSPYTYLWSNPNGTVGTTPSVTALCAGNNSVTITDNNGCKRDTVLFIAEPPPLNSAISNNPETCYGECNGNASVSATGGISPYTFEWSDGSGNYLVINLCPGIYSVSITDSNNCMETDSVTIGTTDFVSTYSFSNNSNCQNCNGLATLSPAGGQSPYSYVWSNGATSSSITGLCAGSFAATVTDATGCDTSFSLSINDPSNMNLSLTDSTNLLCNGICTGSATTAITGGTSPFDYLWSNTNGTVWTTPGISGLCAGTYSLTVTDASECKRFLTVSIEEPAPFIFSGVDYSNPQCYQSNDGSIAVYASGGSTPYSYLWSNNEITSQISNLAAQSYSVTITDNNNCTQDTTIALTQPDSLVSIAYGSPQFCFLNCDGTASVSVSGGTPGYSYLWSNSFNGATSSGLCPGIYTVTVTDANGCTRIDTAFVDTSSFNPQTILLSADTTTLYEGDSTILHALFDTSAVYSWSPSLGLSSSTTPDPVAAPLSTTTYHFIVSSPSDPSCFYSDSITIFVIEHVCGEPDIFVANAFTPDNDNNNDMVFVRGNYIKKMHFIIYDRWGEKIFETENQSTGWDGTYKGMKCDPAVFVYHLSVTCIGDEEFFKKGNITLIR